MMQAHEIKGYIQLILSLSMCDLTNLQSNL